MQALIDLADRQLVELSRQKDEIETAIRDLQTLRDAAAGSI
jgi:hypothetical protein